MDTDPKTNNPPADSVATLSDQISRETDTYRHRQISTFREVAIVQAIATWGVGQLGLEGLTLDYARLLAAAACLTAGLLGAWIIQIYKHRIYYLRDRRNELHSHLVGESEDELTTGKEGEREKEKSLVPKSKPSLSKLPFYPTTSPSEAPLPLRVASSTAYTFALLVVSGATASVNLIAALTH